VSAFFLKTCFTGRMNCGKVTARGRGERLEGKRRGVRSGLKRGRNGKALRSERVCNLVVDKT